MLHKGKVFVFFLSALIVIYGVSAAFYGRVVAKDEAYREISVFIEALNKISSDYVENPDLAKVQEGAMRGLLEALDPNSCFLTKEQAEALEKRQANGSAEIGVVLSKRADTIYVVSTRRGGPADEAGIRPGDYVVAVDGTNVEDKSVIETESLLRGPEGSKVKFTVFRSARTKPLEIEMTRRKVSAASVESRMLDEGIGYLEMDSISKATLEQARTKLKTLISAGAQKLILDLRDCADGGFASGAEFANFFAAGEELANFFLKNGLIYYAQNRKGERVEEIKANPDHFITDLPLVVLINGSTAGGGEIVAGALKDHKRAVIVGEKSFGRGSAQTRIPLKSGSVLFLSTSKMYTPLGKMIQESNLRTTGIKPDVEAPDDDRHQDLLVESYYDDQDDAGKYKKLRERIAKDQMDKAIEILTKGQVPARKAA